MSEFNELLYASEEELVQNFYKFRDDGSVPREEKLAAVGKKFRLRAAQLLCAVGFNPVAPNLTEILPIMGFSNFDELAKERNDVFTSDIYKRVTFDNITEVYNVVKDHTEMMQVMQYLITRRLKNIEGKIEATVNSIIIDKYKSEMRVIYNERIVNLDFVEERLNNQNSGFRALLNEVSIIVESKMIPCGDIFFRESILPEEKRKLLNKGLVPLDLIESRLADETISPEERKILVNYMKQNRETG